MTVHFVGAGPGAADLITVRAQRLLSECSVCLYAGSLVPAEVLAYCPRGAWLVDTADLTLDQITAAMAEADAAGLDVVRLCSGATSATSATRKSSDVRPVSRGPGPTSRGGCRGILPRRAPSRR